MGNTYLEGRGIRPEVLAEIGVEQNKKSARFPFRDISGSLAYRKVIRWHSDGSKETKRDKAGVRTVPFLLNRLNPNDDTLYITEGEVDALSVLSVGDYNVLSVPDGVTVRESMTTELTAPETGEFAWMWQADGELIEPLRRPKNIVLCMDNDEAGKCGARELAIRLDPLKCREAVFPDDCTDLNEILVKHGPEELAAAINGRARLMIPDTVVTSATFRNRPKRPSHEFKNPVLNGLFKWSPPCFAVCTGPPNAGKSQFVMFLCYHLAIECNVKTLYVCFEDEPDKVYDSWDVMHGGTPSAREEFEQKYMMYVDTRDARRNKGLTLEWFLDRVNEAVKRHGCKHIVIDSWNNMEHTWGKESQIVYLNNTLNQLFGLTQEMDIMVTIIAHPDKPSTEGKTEPHQWGLSAIDHGSAFNNKADLGLVVLREHPTTEGWFVNVKSRGPKRWGRLGYKRINYDEERCKYLLAKRG